MFTSGPLAAEGKILFKKGDIFSQVLAFGFKKADLLDRAVLRHLFHVLRGRGRLR